MFDQKKYTGSLPFGEIKNCPACGAGESTYSYTMGSGWPIREFRYMYYCRDVRGDTVIFRAEYIEVICWRCGYSWYTQPLFKEDEDEN